MLHLYPRILYYTSLATCKSVRLTVVSILLDEPRFAGEFPNEFTLPVGIPIWSPASSGLLQEFDDSGSRVKVGGTHTIQCHHEAGVSRVLTHAGAVIVDNEVVVAHDPFGLHRDANTF